MAEFHGTVELIAGITPKNGGDFALVGAHDVQVDDQGNRLDTEFSNLKSALSELTIPASFEKANILKPTRVAWTDFIINDNGSYSAKVGNSMRPFSADGIEYVYVKAEPVEEGKPVGGFYSAGTVTSANLVQIIKESGFYRVPSGTLFVILSYNTENGYEAYSALTAVEENDHLSEDVNCEINAIRDELDFYDTYGEFDNYGQIGIDVRCLKAYLKANITYTFTIHVNSHTSPVYSFVTYNGSSVKSIPTIAVGEDEATASYTCPITGLYYVTFNSSKLAEITVTVEQSNQTKIEVINANINELQNQIGSMSGLKHDVVDPDVYMYRKAMPPYYCNQNDLNSNSYLDNKVYSVPNGKHFLFVTDDHWASNAKKVIENLQYVRKLIKAKHVINGGDYLNIASTKSLGMNHLTDSAGRYRSAFGKYYLPVRGNHDDNCNSGSTPMTDDEKAVRFIEPSVVYNIVFGSLKGEVNAEDVASKLSGVGLTAEHVNEMTALMDMTYYVDDAENEIRYIVTNTGATGYKYPLDDFNLWSYQESWLNLDFIANAIKTIPNNYDLVVVGHMFCDAHATQDDNGRVPTYSFVSTLGKLMTALKKKASVTVSLPSGLGNSTFEQYMAGTSFTYDFSDSNTVGKMIILSGHFHTDGVCVYDGNIRVRVWNGEPLVQSNNTVEIPLIQTTTDAYLQTNTISPAMTLDTVTEQAFDVVTITDNGISTVRIGAGDDRFITIT